MGSRQEESGQPATRRPGTVTDQHGRKWSVSIDKKSGFPVGSMHPKDWRAPWVPAQSTDVFRFNQDDPTRFTINYEFLLEERLQAEKQDNDAREAAAAVRGWDPSDPEKQPALDQLCGKSNRQPPQIIVACMQGDPWVLGLTQKVNPKVLAFLPKKVDRKTALLSRFPDFTAQEPDELEERLDIEEAVDPDATGGKKVAVKPKKTKQVA